MDVDTFVTRFLQFYGQLFLFHWQTDAYARHIAYGEANEDMELLVDKFVEAYQGKHGRVSIDGQAGVEFYDLDSVSPEDFIGGYLDYLVNEAPLGLTDEDDDLLNILDEMVARLNKLRYLMTLE